MSSCSTVGFLKVYEFVTEEIKFGWARIRLPYEEIHVRAGGKIAGPALIALADYTFFCSDGCERPSVNGRDVEP